MKSLLSSLALACALAPIAASAAPKVTVAAGPAQADLLSAVASFRTEIALGGAGNIGVVPLANGFRNINWDGAPDSLAAPAALPADFFNGSIRRGAMFFAPQPGATVQVSASFDNAAGTPPRFGNVDPSYATRFKAFTEQRLFAAVGGNVIETLFFVPGSPGTAATVNGFGAIFCDVDLPNVSSIECFDAADKSLGKFYAPVADNGFSFVGVFFADGERVARVRITHGNLPLAPGNVDTATGDVVATDDFMYGEPLPRASDATLVNISTRAKLGSGDDVAVTGFVVSGTQPKLFLVRAVGPTLAPFIAGGSIGALANPQLTVFNGAGQVVATNDDWGNRPEIAQAAARAGAFPLLANSTDAATLVVLNPGAYTVVTSGTGALGLVLTEVYEVK